jgi:hypothetical protein
VRTTVTLDADTESLVRRLMKTRGVSFKQALNDAIRAGAQQQTATFQTRVHRMGQPSVALDRALQLAGELEDEELLRRMRTRQ